MQNFRTTLELKKEQHSINFNDRIMLMGSCFTENIGAKLGYVKMQTEINPFGILYNPVSIANSFNFILNDINFTEKELFNESGIWHSFYHHSRFSGLNKDTVLQNINNRISKASLFLNSTNYLILTFGTAWIYEHISSNKIVSNCHKIPAREFSRRRLTVLEICKIYNELIEKITATNHDIKIIFTVSPVRHMKDGSIENQLSKSTLLLAVNEIIRNNDNCFYFPSYEIMMDDLRDYRFYEADMIHPSAQAVEYIWRIFTDTWFNDNTESIFNEIDKLKKAALHKPFQPQAPAHQQFIKKQLEKVNALQNRYSFINLTEEEEIFTSQII